MKDSLIVLITSWVCKWLLDKIFFIHGTFVAITRGELTAYWKELAIVNDVYLNVSGKYLLNQRLSKNQVFGNRLMTVSAAMHLAKFENAGTKWERRIKKLDKNHFEKAYLSHKENITNEFLNLK